MTAISWNSAISGSWTLGSNWSSGSVPGSGDDVTIGIAGAYTVTLTAAISVNSITISDAQATLAIADPGGTDTIAANIANSGTLDIDSSGQGGSFLALGATLSNSGVADIGNTNLSKATTVTASGLVNSGVINLDGGITAQAALLVGGAAPATLGNLNILDDALLQFASGAVGGIASGTTFSLRDDPTGISLNAGVTTTGTFSNAGNLDVDNYNGGFGHDAGGSNLALGATLSNSGVADIGNTNLSKATTVTASGLVNSGVINLDGGVTAQAALLVGGAAPATLGNLNILDDALLQFASGAVGGIASGTTFSLRDDPTGISLNAGVTTTGTFSNAGNLDVDNYNGGFGHDAGGSFLALGATLSNSGVADIGNTNLSKATTVTASGLVNSGVINLDGGGTAQAALLVGGAAPATLGNLNILDDALLQFASGAVGGIASGTTFSLRDDPTGISLNAGVTTTGTFSNAGNLDVDNYNGGFGHDAGGSFLALGATLSNSGVADIGNTNLSKATTVTASGLVNSGVINLDGGVTAQAALLVGGAAPATLGNLNILDDALLQFASGAVGGIASGTTFSLRDDPTGISLNAGVTTTGTFGNAGNLDVDNYNGGFGHDAGGSFLALGATLSNSGVADIGNTNLSKATTVTASGLVNSGVINLDGGGTAQAALLVGGAAPATLGNLNILDDALLQFASGAVGGIASGTTFSLRDDPTGISLNAGVTTTGTFSNAGNLDVDNYNGGFGHDAGGSFLALGATLSNSGVADIGNTNLSKATTVTASGLVNSGVINLDGGVTAQAALLVGGAAPATLGNLNILDDALLQFASGAVGGIASGTTFSLRDDPTGISLNAGVTTTGTFSNAGNLDVDNYNGGFGHDAGGSFLALGATLSNSGVADIGNTNLSKATTVTASGLVNSGVINLDGGGTAQAALLVGGAAPATLGNLNILDDALLQFASGAVGGIASGTTFSLRDDPTGISLNAGVTTTGTFGNAGNLDVDNYNGGFGHDAGGSFLALGATLSNSGVADIGNTNLSKATTVTASGLVNSGVINLDGGGTAQAALLVGGAAPATLGNLNILDDALLQFASGAVGGIASGTTFSLRDDPTGISLNAGVTTTGTFGNAGNLDVDNYNGGFGHDAGGSFLALGATLSNSGVADIGNTNLSKATTVTASGLVNSGVINLDGGGTAQAALLVGGAAPATLGNLNILDDALLQFASGAVGGIASGTTFSLRDDPTGISLNAGVTTTGTFGNAGNLDVDNYNGGFGHDAGGSFLALGATLSNSGVADIGNTNLSKATTVTASGLVNSGVINLDGGGTAQAALDIAGAGNDTGSISLGGNALLSAGSLVVQGSGRITVAAGGTLAAGSVINAGTIADTGTAASDSGISFGQGGTLINQAGGLITARQAAVALYGSAAATVTNAGTIAGGTGIAIAAADTATDTIVNYGTITGNPAVQFGGGVDLLVMEPRSVVNGPIAGFAAADAIDLVNAIATGAVFYGTTAGGTLSVMNGAAVVESLQFTGSFAANGFVLSPDGNNGVDIRLRQSLGNVIGITVNYTVVPSNPGVTTVTSTGTIAAPSGDGIVNVTGSAGSLLNLGTISATGAGSHGIYLGSGGAITNASSGGVAGYIAGSAVGVAIAAGTATVVNTGTITGGSGILIAAGSIATVTNSGVVAGTAGVAVSLGGGSNRLVLGPGSLLVGEADGGGGSSVLEVTGLAGAAANLGALLAAAGANAYVGLGSIANFTSLQIDAGATADAAGALSFDTLVNQGQINVAAGDALAVGLVASAANVGVIGLHPGGLVEFTGAVAAQTIEFGPSGGTAVIDQPAAFSGTLADFAAGDTIDLAGATASGAQYAAGMLSLSVGGTPVALIVTTPYATPQFLLGGDGQGGTAITVEPAAAPRDFTGDGTSDLLFQNTDGNLAMWLMNGGTVASSSIFAFADPAVWSVAGTGDFTGDGRSDILWQDTSGDVAIWQVNGPTITASSLVGFADPSWHIRTTGDFTGDGTSDILFQNDNGNLAIWEMNGGTVQSSSIFAFADPSVWHVAGSGDFNGDGRSDILWQDTSGDVAIWEMNGFSVAASAIVGFAAPGWHIRGTGDFTGEGTSDILFQNDDGNLAMWEMNGLSVAASSIFGFADPSVWHVADIGDFTGDGRSDIVWQDTSGDIAMWQMNGFSVVASALVGFADPAWQIVPPDNTGDTLAPPAAAGGSNPLPLPGYPTPTATGPATPLSALPA